MDRAREAEGVLKKISAGVAYDKGSGDLALGLAYQATALNPDDYSPYYLIGKICLDQGKRDIAKLAFEKALKNSEKNNTVIFQTNRAVDYDRKLIVENLKLLQSNGSAN